MARSLAVTLILSLFLTKGAPAQLTAFGVYFTAGTVTYIPARGPSRALETHTFLKATDRVTLSDNIAQVILFSPDTSYVELEGKGTYTTAAIAKLPHHPIRDPMVIKYFSFFWSPPSSSPPRDPLTSSISRNPPSSSISRNSVSFSDLKSFIIKPRPEYVTSLDSLIFEWRNVSWARKYFLRLRSPEGDIRYDSVLVDTQVIVHFPGHLKMGIAYNWAVDIVGEGGRLQFADSGHLIWIDETKVLQQLPPLPFDSLGGIAATLEQIEQYENAGCIRQADSLFQRLSSSFPLDAALDKLYAAFRERNYY